MTRKHVEGGTMATRCIIYSRVSTDAQERDSTSLETQERACTEYAEAQGWTIVCTLRDTGSGFSLDRPGIAEIRSLAGRGQVDVILSYALDRLSRKQTHVAILVEQVEEYGASLSFVTEKFEDTATGQLLRSVKAFAAEFEREKITERTMRGKAERARSGRLPQGMGQGLYGYLYDPASGKRKIAPDQADIVRRLFDEFISGASITGLAKALNEDGIPTMHGKLWQPTTIYQMLRNPCYEGRTTYRRTKAMWIKDPSTGRKKRRVTVRPKEDWIEIPDATPAIVSATVFQAVQARLDDPERLRRGRRRFAYGLAGRIRCKRCGSAMVGQTLRRRYRYYRCKRAFADLKHERCASRYVRADKLEAGLLAKIADTLSQPNVILRELTRMTARAEARVDQADIRQRVASIEQRRTRLLRLYEFGEIDDDYLKRESSNLQAERQRLLSLLPSEPSPAFDLPSESDVAALCSRVRSWVARRGPEEMSLISRALQLSIMASTDQSEVSGVIPEYSPRNEHQGAYRDEPEERVRPMCLVGGQTDANVSQLLTERKI